MLLQVCQCAMVTLPGHVSELSSQRQLQFKKLVLIVHSARGANVGWESMVGNGICKAKAKVRVVAWIGVDIPGKGAGLDVEVLVGSKKVCEKANIK